MNQIVSVYVSPEEGRRNVRGYPQDRYKLNGEFNGCTLFRCLAYRISSHRHTNLFIVPSIVRVSNVEQW